MNRLARHFQKPRHWLTALMCGALLVALAAHDIKGVVYVPAVLVMVGAGIALTVLVATNPGGTR